MSHAYSTGRKAPAFLPEQLPLFAIEDPSEKSSAVTVEWQSGLSRREQLALLLAGDLDFQGERTSHATHDLHAFAAKFPPQLPRTFIIGLTEPGDIVLDPMMGSGTTIVEALLDGRNAVGLDIDPLALRTTSVKATAIELNTLHDAGHRLLGRAHKIYADDSSVQQALAKRFDERTKEFINYWFLPSTQLELMALLLAIEEVSDVPIRRFFELTFSAIIVTKSGGVSVARDLAHSRPHKDKTKVPKNALEQFSIRLRKNLLSMAQLHTARVTGVGVAPLAADARHMPLADSSVDLIVTSPPYANAIDYMRAHKFSLVWFGETVSDLSKLRATYIGSEHRGQMTSEALPPSAEATIHALSLLDGGKASILRKYFLEMRQVIGEMYRVLRNDSAAIVVVGTSTMRGVDVQTHTGLAEIGAEVGFDVVGVVPRNLDRNKRMMPARFGKKSDSMIEQRMHEEYVIGLLKPQDAGVFDADA